jgi:hypothetical protein
VQAPPDNRHAASAIRNGAQHVAPGQRPNPPASPALRTRLLSKVQMVMDDAFRESTRAPFQQFYFDEVIPDQMRAADVKTALRDRGFNLLDFILPGGEAELRQLIFASRPAGADMMQLWIVVEGRRYMTERRTEVPGGQVFTSMLASGGITVYMRGQIPGDTKLVLQEMMLIQEALRERFERLRTRR